MIKAVNTEETGDLITMLGELIQIRFPDEISVLLCIRFNKNNLDAIVNANEELIDETTPPNYTTMFFKITTIDHGHRNIMEVLAEKKDFRVNRKEDLAQFFTGRVLRHYTAKRYLMFTWDHGNGFEIFSDGTNQLKANKGVAALRMDDLAKAIGWSMKDQKIHLVIMMNCSMQVFDTGHALRNHVKYLVAPETQLGFMEYDYFGIFSYLAHKPNVSPRALAARVISSFKEKSLTQGTGLTVALSVCLLKHFDLMAMLLNQLATKLLQRLPRDFDCIRKTFNAAKRIQEGTLLDLYSLLTELSANGTEEERFLINQLFLLKYRGVYRRFIGADLFNNDSPAAELYNGISILAPVLPEDLFRDGNTKKFFMESEFLETSVWGELFRKLKDLEAHPSPPSTARPCVAPSERLLLE